MPFECTCWTLELSSHVVENLWSGTTPQEFLLARVPTIVMVILKDLFLARCQRFPDTCFTVATILIVRGISSVTISSAPLPSGSSSCCSVSTGEEQARRFFGVWRLACEISQHVHSIFSWESNLVSFEPRVVMEEASEVRIVHDIEMTSTVQFHSLAGFSKQSVLTENVELTRPHETCLWALAGDQNMANERWRWPNATLPNRRRELWNLVFLFYLKWVFL